MALMDPKAGLWWFMISMGSEYLVLSFLLDKNA
jgi:hypothetical protein